jgi:predicted membrane protein
MRTDGSVFAGVLAMVLVGPLGGALAGLIIASMTGSQAVIALVGAIVGALVALVLRRIIWGKQSRLSPSSPIVLWNLIMASLVGALAGHELAVDIGNPPVSPLIGGTSGLIAAVLMASSLVTIVWVMDQPDKG